MTNLVCTADLHGHLPEDLPEGDVLIIAGDVCPVWNHNRQFQAAWLKATFAEWLRELPYDDIIFIAGNHDYVLMETKEDASRWFPRDKVHYLKDSAVTFGGTTFWGTPWTPRFGNWAFMTSEEELAHIFGLIPSGTNVLISHGPPKGVCDRTEVWEDNAGSTALCERIEQLYDTLQYVICGHIHEAYGSGKLGWTEIYNVSLMNFAYNPVNAPVVLDI